ncbi:unnamed protein product [Leptidea sinapis]|uniref:Ribosomal protein n=1 Tax=Leptidea sinapis TaxID=189913 RepID=A0A5E4PL86_9NEOP|nr:unnamed protein product [Leptidea sinapis]
MQRIFSLSRIWIGASSLATKPISATYSAIQNVLGPDKLLSVQSPLLNFACNLKVRGKVKRRCKACYLVARDGRLYNMCAERPRHKQVLRAPKPLNTWILTHASQSKVRPW